jgi:hypothetical protein
MALGGMVGAEGAALSARADAPRPFSFFCLEQ